MWDVNLHKFCGLLAYKSLFSCQELRLHMYLPVPAAFCKEPRDTETIHWDVLVDDILF